MARSLRSPRAALFTCLLSLAAGACTDFEEPSALTGPQFASVGAGSHADAVSVYTQNLWLGGSTGPLFSIDLGDLSQVIPAVNLFWAQVLASNVPERAVEFVNELEERQPEVVGLQEAVGYATGSLNLATGEFTPTALGPDLLVSVMTEIGTRGLPYSIAVMQDMTGIALPLDLPDASFVAPALAIQDRVVMLKRDDVVATGLASGIYDARIDLGPVDFIRGWVRMTVEQDGVDHHYIATHLETQAARPINEAQGLELIELVDALDGVAVVMGDLNSDAAADPSAPSWTETYDNLIGAGFSDVWYESAPRAPSDDGVTCCLEDDPAGIVPVERIDFILVRSDRLANDEGRHRGFFEAEVIGDMESDRTPSGLWPSDHAGLIGSLRLPGGTR